MRFLILLLIPFFFVTFSFAQSDPEKKIKLDSLKAKLTADSLHTYRFKILRPYGSIDNRNSFIRPSNFNGYQLGVIVNEYHTFGLGFYRLNAANKASSTIQDGYKLRALSYNTVFYQYLLFRKRYYEVDLPFELGYGRYRARISDTLREDYNQGIAGAFLPLSAGIECTVKPVRWIGLSVMVGYRYFLQQNTVLDFNGFYFPVGIWVDLRQVYRDIKYFGFQKKRYRREVKKILEN
ncbi:MAG: hypothetical protein V4635_03425 [Bacteroidota bacterium]